jgi:hypothetical protein
MRSLPSACRRFDLVIREQHMCSSQGAPAAIDQEASSAVCRRSVHVRQALTVNRRPIISRRVVSADADMFDVTDGAAAAEGKDSGQDEQTAVMLPLTPVSGGTSGAASPPAAHSPGFSDMGVRACWSMHAGLQCSACNIATRNAMPCSLYKLHNLLDTLQTP